MKKYFPLLFTVIAAVCLHSCMAENNECLPKLRLTFSYSLNAEDKELLAEEVGDILAYIFDENEQLYKVQAIRVNKLGKSRMADIEVDPGRYRIVALGNIDNDYYYVDGANSTRSGFGVHLATDQNGEANGTAIDLFHGSAEADVTTEMVAEAKISFIKNTNTINIILSPDDGTRTIPGTDVSVRISGTNGVLDFDNSNAATTATIYRPDYSKVLYENAMYDQARFKVMKLEVGDDTMIHISKEGVLLQEDSLTDLIMHHFPHIRTNADFDRYSEYTFVYEYDPVTGFWVLASITVDGWTENTLPGHI